ncbi:auxin efflux carrier component 2-like [Gastrolobium bilobum]|uniref:auxin efflux carrier component 2-like n=1 Tax=Gastrolobium bilobum TaxID=150636 RepID=UPI002AB06EA4|nr:auxin efflux carrier component 2-like [Gastrolobium bilobum]
MIKGKDIYQVLAAIVPQYVAIVLAYGSVRWWKIFTPEQCSGINRFVSMFAVPFLVFHFISSNDPYSMNFKLIAADSLQKVVILGSLFLWNTVTTKYSCLDWTITLFSLSTLPNTLIMGVPLLKAMYGDFTSTLMIQIVVLQGVVWFNILLFLFEYRGAKHLISEQFPETAGSITSVRVDSDVNSLSGREPLQADAEIGEDGKFHVVVRRSASSSFNKSLTGVEEEMLKMQKKRGWRSKSCNDLKPMFSRSVSDGQRNKDIRGGNPNKELHMFVWNSSTPPASDVNWRHAVNGTIDPFKVVDIAPEIATSKERVVEIEEGIEYPLSGCKREVNIEERDANKKQQMPHGSVMTRLILIMVWRKLIRSPITYASLLGLAWSLISFRWNIKMPSIINGSILILSNTGLGMAMFALGLFMGLQPKIIACGKSLAAISMAIRFLVGPAVTAATSAAIGIRGVLLHVTIVQAALPLAINPFVFAEEYNLHADVICTALIFGMVISLPVTVLYFVLLGL